MRESPLCRDVKLENEVELDIAKGRAGYLDSSGVHPVANIKTFTRDASKQAVQLT